MKVPGIDERFLHHRLRSTSLGGQAAIVFAYALFLYRLFVDHVTSWDLAAVGVVMVMVKIAAMIWFRFRD